mgnify:CR=1 FL=1
MTGGMSGTWTIGRRLAALLRCAALAAGFVLPAASAAADGAVTDAPTPGGLRLAHLQLAGESEQALAFFWRDGGALAAPDKAGLIELAPNLMVAGGGARFDGAATDEALKDYGASLALRRSAATTSGELVAAAKHFSQAAEVLADILTAPRLPPRTLERERAALLAGVRAQTERPDRLASRLLTRALFGRVPERALWLMEPREVVEGVGVADVEAWRRATLGRDNLVVVAAGVGGISPRLAEKSQLILYACDPGSCPLLRRGGLIIWSDFEVMEG